MYPDTAKGNRSARKAAAKEMSYTIAQKSRLAKERGKSHCAAITTGFTPSKSETAVGRGKRFAKIKGAKSHKGVRVVPAGGDRFEPVLKAKKRTAPVIRPMNEKQREVESVKKRRKEEREARARGVAELKAKKK
tara:strand:- start:177 stop:578 length:402 start_codon:yes stop_codon:yes gene_type:complete